MKRNLLFGAIALLAGSLMAADSTPKDEVTEAANKLGDNYTWKSTMDLGASAQFGPFVTDGKMAGDMAWLSSTFGDNANEGFRKGTNVVFKAEDGWQTLAEATAGDNGGGGGGFGNPGLRIARQLQTLKGPASDITNALAQAKELTKDGDAYKADLTDDGAKALSTFGGRRGGFGGAPTDAKGSVKIWLKDGAVTKYELKLTGKMTGRDGGDPTDFERNTTVEIKDVGATKIEPPDDAKKKLS